MMSQVPFSRRFGYRSPRPITVREGAPIELRMAILKLANGLGMRDTDGVVRRVLPLGGLVGCKQWYRVYDVAEAIHTAMEEHHDPRMAATFEEQLNEYFEDEGIGWQMRDGKIEVRGSEPFEAVARSAARTLAEYDRQTSAHEMHEALQDLSRRPEPDVSGAIQHAMAALECVARDVGKSSATLGRVINDNAAAIGIQPPLDTALEKLWGYASEQGRHFYEGRKNPTFEEAELVVTVAAAVSVYLSKKFKVPADGV